MPLFGNTINSVTMSVNTADVPPESVVYGRTVAINDVLNWTASCPRDGGGTGTVIIDTLGVPTITGTFGNYTITFDYDGGASETYLYGHTNESVLLAAFTVPAQDSDGNTTRPSPESTARLIYVDPDAANNTSAGPGADSAPGYYLESELPGGTWDAPSSVNAYKDWNEAIANMRQGQGDYLLFARGATADNEATADTGGWSVTGGKSHTYPTYIGAYGTGALPTFMADATVGTGAVINGGSGDNYVHFYDIDFHAKYRDPADAKFNGYGDTEIAIDIMRWYHATESVDGWHIERCLFRFCAVKFGEGSGEFRGVIRRNVFWSAYSEASTFGGMFSNNIAFLLEENLFYKGGWLIARDSGTYPDQPATGAHDGTPAGTTFQDSSNAVYTSGMIGSMIENSTTGKLGKLNTVPSTTTITAYKTIADEYADHGTTTGTVLMTWATGDLLKVRSGWMRGQADDQNHNVYTPYAGGSIYRDNIFLEGSSSNIKLTAVPSESADPGGPYSYEEIIISGNYFAGTAVDLSADLNTGSKDWQARFEDLRYMNNVSTKNGYFIFFGTSAGSGVNAWWMKDSYFGNNVFTTFPDGTADIGMNFSRIQDNTIVASNIIVDLGKASGTNINASRGGLSVSTDAYTKDMDFINNEVQMQTTDHVCIGSSVTGKSVTYTGNKYYSTRATDDWFEFDDVRKTEAQWVAQFTDTGYTTTQITYTDKQTHESYMTDQGEGTTTIEQLAIKYRDMIINDSWSTDYTKWGARYITRNFRDGYK